MERVHWRQAAISKRAKKVFCSFMLYLATFCLEPLQGSASIDWVCFGAIFRSHFLQSTAFEASRIWCA
jgi:hypothetical protein